MRIEMDYKDIVSNVDIYDLEKSILASGYPMRTIIPDRDITEKDLARCKNLVNATKMVMELMLNL